MTLFVWTTAAEAPRENVPENRCRWPARASMLAFSSVPPLQLVAGDRQEFGEHALHASMAHAPRTHRISTSWQGKRKADLDTGY